MDRSAVNAPDADASSQQARACRASYEYALRSGDALLVTDVQRDFLPGGRLPVPKGDAVVAPINACIRAFADRQLPIFLTRDWHPLHHCSFVSEGGPWPTHCVAGTPGAAWPSDLIVPADAYIISKATEPSAEAYSAFSGTTLQASLASLNTKRVFVGGLATDYCVLATVLDALAHGFEVVVLSDAIRGIDAQPGDVARATDQMVCRGATLCDSASISLDSGFGSWSKQ